MQCALDGRIPLPPQTVTTPPSGGTGSGGGSGSCPEFAAPVYVQRYSDTGALLFEGEIKAGEVRLGFESDDGTVKRGDFLKGYGFGKQQDIYRAVQQYQHVPCGGWVLIDGIRFTACEAVSEAGRWMPAYKVPGAVQDNSVGIKVLIQVEADWDEEHNYYAGTRLIHNTVLGC